MPDRTKPRGGDIQLAAVGAALLGLGTLVYTTKRLAESVEVNELHLKLPRLAAEFDGYRIAHITDLHAGRLVKPEWIAGVIEMVNTCHPDLIAVTGDFVTHHSGKYSPELAPVLAKLRASDGVYAVLGNHDHWSGAAVVRQMLAEAGIQELENRFVTLQRGPACLHIAGVDSAYLGKHQVERVLCKLPESGSAVLLAHEPDVAEESAASGRFDLQLSGHTHGGQINIPWLSRLFLPRLGSKFASGLYQVGGMWLYTNRGLGTIHLPLRLNARPEIAVLVLEPAPEGG